MQSSDTAAQSTPGVRLTIRTAAARSSVGSMWCAFFSPQRIGFTCRMHDSDLPTFSIISLPIIFKRTVDQSLEFKCLMHDRLRFHGPMRGPALRGRVKRIRIARFENAGELQSCMVSKSRIVRKQTVEGLFFKCPFSLCSALIAWLCGLMAAGGLTNRGSGRLPLFLQPLNELPCAQRLNTQTGVVWTPQMLVAFASGRLVVVTRMRSTYIYMHGIVYAIGLGVAERHACLGA